MSVHSDAIVVGVTYRHFAGRYEKMIPQRVEQATIDYYRAWKTDGEPETENESYWFARALYEHHKKPFWYFFKPTNTLIVVPAPPDDGSLVSVVVDEPPDEVEHIDLYAPLALSYPTEKITNGKEPTTA